MDKGIIIGISIYIFLMLLVGYISSRRIKNLSDFLVAGRRLPFFLALATLFATWFGAGSCMGAAGTAYREGILGVIPDPYSAGLSLIVAGLFYVATLRRLKLLTVTDVFGIYYSRGTEIFASILMIPVYIGWLGSQMVALGYIANILTGIDEATGIIIGAVVVLIYTFAGGMWAVTLTDLIQVCILICGILIIFPFVMSHIGGFNALIKSTPHTYWRIFPHTVGYNGWVAYIGQWLLMGLGCVVGQDLIQRALASRTEKIAKYSTISAGFLYIMIGTIPVTLGLAGRIILPNLSDPELVLPKLAMMFLPSMLLSLFLGALISAIMSSADSSLLAATSLLTNNIIVKSLPNLKEGSVLIIARVTTLLTALFSLGVALYVKQIYHLMVNSWATLLVGIFVPVTAALYWKRANLKSAWTSMICGTSVWLGYILLNTPNLQEIADPLFYRAATYGGTASLLSYLITTLITKFTNRVSPSQPIRF